MERNKIVEAASRYQRNFVPDRFTAAPNRHLVILTCMDARLDLFRLLGLETGDAHILRNAGGRASDDAIRSMTVSAQLLGTREFVVIHHTGCGLHGATNAGLSDLVEKTVGTRPTFDFLAFDDLEASVRTDVDRIATCELLPHDAIVWGAIYDVHTGELRTVTEALPMMRPVAGKS